MIWNGYFRLYQICVYTSVPRVYYAIVSKLRSAGLPFTSVMSLVECVDCVLIISGAGEAGQFGNRALALESLAEDPGVFKGQVFSKLNGGNDALLLGVDPGTRIGLAVFYGNASLEYSTFGNVMALSRRVGDFVRGVPARRCIVRVGNGSPSMTLRLVRLLKLESGKATIEVVDESGTSVGRVRVKGIQRDEGAAARIAFRKGEVVAFR